MHPPLIRWLHLFVFSLFLTPVFLHAQHPPVDWQQEPGLSAGSFTDIAEDPNTDRVWGIANGRVHYSDDFGEQWVHLDIETSYAANFAFREEGGVFVDRYRSYDQGETWETTNFPDSLEIRNLYFDNQAGHLLASTREAIYYSSDDGDTWVEGLSALIGRIAIPRGGSVLATVADNDTSPLRVVFSPDGGISWIDLSPPLMRLGDIIVGANGDLYVSGGGSSVWQLYRSTDQGMTWEKVHEEDVRRGACAGLLRRAVAINAEQEILFESGITWFSLDTNTCTPNYLNIPQEFDVNGAALEPDATVEMLALGEDDRLYAFTRANQLYRSDDGGGSWNRLSMGGVEGASTFLRYTDPSGAFLLATSLDGLYSKQQGASSWTYLGYSLETVQQILQGTAPGSLWMLREDVILESTDEGQTWTTLIEIEDITGREYNEPYRIIYDSERGIHYLLEVFNVFYSTDGGESWQSTNVPQESQIDGTVLAMEITPEGHLMVYARHDIFNGLEGLWLTKDLGETWELVFEEKIGFPEYFFDSTDRLWMRFGSQLRLSEDGGMTWEEVSLGDHSFFIYNMTETPDRSLWLNHSCGLFRSVDRGATWEELFPDGTTNVQSLLWAEQEQQLILSTRNGEIYRGFIDTSIRVTVEDPLPNAVDGYSLSAYPNPVAGRVHIRFSLSQDTPVVLEVYDSLGRRVDRLMDRYLGVGDHEVGYLAEGLAPGVYMVRLQTAEAVEVGGFVRVE